METPRDNTNVFLIIALIVGSAILFCVCAVVGLAVFMLLGPAVGPVIGPTPIPPVP